MWCIIILWLIVSVAALAGLWAAGHVGSRRKTVDDD
jgi:hypothetical protein